MKRKVYSLLGLLMAIPLLAAPVYNAANPVPLGPGVTATVWSAETPTPGNGTTAASQQVSLSNKGTGTGFSCDGKFSGAPGVFEVDVQVAAADSDTNYQTAANANITTVDSTNQTWHFDGTLVNAKYARLLMRTRTNSVSITATCGQ